MYPPVIPWTSNVGSAQIRFITSIASLVRSFLKRWSFLNPATVKPERANSPSSFFVTGMTSS